MDIKSLHYKYAFVALAMAMSILIAAISADYLLADTQNIVKENFENRQALISRSRVVRNNLWQAREAISQFVVSPDNIENQEALHQTINEALNSVDRLLEIKNRLSFEQHASAIQIRTLLLELDAAVAELIIIRLNPEILFPSLEIGTTRLLPIQQEVFDLLFVILQNASEKGLNTEEKLEFFKLVGETRHIWSMTVIRVRLLLLNRIGSFGFDETTQQQEILDVYISQFNKNIEQLNEYNTKYKLGINHRFELEEIQELSKEWVEHYKEMVVLHNSPYWRNDTRIIKIKITPLFDELWNALLHLDLTFENSANINVHNLTSVADTQSQTIWLIGLISFAFVVFGYFSLRTTILNPLHLLVRAFKTGSSNKNNQYLPKRSSTEFDLLISAFAEMQEEVQHKQDNLHHQAMHDSLTGLANRALLLNRLEHALDEAARNEKHLSVIIMDLDRFKIVNDTLGHQVGDELLIAVAMRLKCLLREVDTVSRLGGDEFSVLLNNTGEKEARHVGQKIVRAFEKSFRISDHELYVGASVGVAIYPYHGTDKTSLIKSADIAMYIAKKNHLGYVVYDDNKDTSDSNSLTLANDLRNVINNSLDDLYVVYQLKYDTNTQDVIGAEALLRWQHPTLGFVDPPRIIMLAEQLGIISKLTRWILESSIEQCAEWHKHGYKISVAVNFSIYDLQEMDISEHIQFLLQDNNLPAKYLTIEITESAMMIDPTNAISILNKLDKMGVQISIDDFGTGFSSLSYLKKMPVCELKIDKSFVMDMINDENDAVIVKSIIDLAHNLSLKVVAEGVETVNIYNVLKELSCDTLQGFLLNRPTKAAEILPLLSNGRKNGIDSIHAKNVV